MVVFWEELGTDKKRRLKISPDETRKDSTSFIIYPPMTPRTIPAPTLPYRVENWTLDTETQPSKTWVLQTGLRHVDYSSALPTLGRWILEGEASWNQHPSFKGEFSFTKGYWEWTEVILGMHRDLLEAIMIYDGIYASLFTYDRSTHIVQAFCEAWCPMTNSLLTSVGELSISLWDIHVLCGLPISGDIYDEYVPSASELTGTDAGPTPTPRCCKYLFQAYSYLYNRNRQRGGNRNKRDDGRSVHVNEWIEFWSRRPPTYDRPLPRKEEKRKIRPKGTQNPDGKIPSYKGWTKTTRAPFVELGIPREYAEETHLAAYLSCWLCVFVLPIKATRLIRYQTFKMASLMATGHTLNLAIPVLASIYNGLNAIANSNTPGQVDSRFPIHYLYGWLSFYFDTHFANDQTSASPLMITYSGEGGARYYGQVEARRKIFKADNVNWGCTTRRLTKDLRFADDGNDNPPNDEYFMCLRSNFLVLRWANSCIAEPYTPHRFSRQFGYYQDGNLGILGKDERRVTLAEGFQRWRHFTLRGSGSQITFPATRVTMKKYFSQSYRDWWTQVHGDYLERHIRDLVPEHPADMQQEAGTTKKGKRPIQEDEPSPKKRKQNTTSKQRVNAVPDLGSEEGDDRDRYFKQERRRNRRSPSPARDDVEMPANEEVESSNKKTTGSIVGESEHSNDALEHSSPRSGSSHDEPQTDHIHRPEVSIFDGKDIVLEEFKVVVINVWNKLRRRLEETPVEHISSLQESFNSAFANLHKLDLNISSLEARVEEIFKKALEFDELRSTISEKMSSESQGTSLSTAKDELNNAQDEVARLKKDLLEQHKAFKAAQDRESELERELELARAMREDCDTSITKITEDLGNAKTVVSKAEAEVTRIQKLTVLTPEDANKLKQAKGDLEAYKNDMLNFRLFVN